MLDFGRGRGVSKEGILIIFPLFFPLDPRSPYNKLARYMDPIGIRYGTLRFSSLAVDSGGEIVAASAKGASVFVADRAGCGK